MALVLVASHADIDYINVLQVSPPNSKVLRWQASGKCRPRWFITHPKIAHVIYSLSDRLTVLRLQRQPTPIRSLEQTHLDQLQDRSIGHGAAHGVVTPDGSILAVVTVRQSLP